MSIKFSGLTKTKYKNINSICILIKSENSDISLDNGLITIKLDSNDNPDKIIDDFFEESKPKLNLLFHYEISEEDNSFTGLVYIAEFSDNLESISKGITSINNLNLVDLNENSSKIIKKIINYKKNYFIYILRCSDNSLYTGIATDYKNRFSKHKNKTGAKYTQNKTPIKIEKVWSISGRSMASKIECHIKSLSKKQKEDLIKNPLLLKSVYSEIAVEL